MLFKVYVALGWSEMKSAFENGGESLVSDITGGCNRLPLVSIVSKLDFIHFSEAEMLRL